MTLPEEIEQERQRLLATLMDMGEFRRGSLNVVYRRCGKASCACMKKDHPGHGPLMTLTFTEAGKTRTRSLPTNASVDLVQQQIRRHDEFLEWYKQWRDLNEKISDIRLEEALRAVEVDKAGRSSGGAVCASVR
jgi:hypothetical protein